MENVNCAVTGGNDSVSFGLLALSLPPPLCKVANKWLTIDWHFTHTTSHTHLQAIEDWEST